MNRINSYTDKYNIKYNKKIKTKRAKLSIVLLIICILILGVMNINSIMAYFTDKSSAINKFTIANCYVVKFNANGGTGSMADQEIYYDDEVKLQKNLFTKEGYNFYKWNTEPNGSGNSYDDGQEVKNLTKEDGAEINLYAQWVSGVAEIDGTIYPTLQKAIDSVSTDNTETTIKLLCNISENVTVKNNQNIVFNLQDYTITNSADKAVITNNGTIAISNGTITTSSKNNRSD